MVLIEIYRERERENKDIITDLVSDGDKHFYIQKINQPFIYLFLYTNWVVLIKLYRERESKDIINNLVSDGGMHFYIFIFRKLINLLFMNYFHIPN